MYQFSNAAGRIQAREKSWITTLEPEGKPQAGDAVNERERMGQSVLGHGRNEGKQAAVREDGGREQESNKPVDGRCQARHLRRRIMIERSLNDFEHTTFDISRVPGTAEKKDTTFPTPSWGENLTGTYPTWPNANVTQAQTSSFATPEYSAMQSDMLMMLPDTQMPGPAPATQGRKTGLRQLWDIWWRTELHDKPEFPPNFF
ncbi:hypothetical protein B0H10DRAFT_2189827 [Mycena sp. CBHHK59/15]|nr:hypothetical protein B0H10DRAFT_2189827 [Mycena sp. CBHHK59/15]